jgi:hypothetical protein
MDGWCILAYEKLHMKGEKWDMVDDKLQADGGGLMKHVDGENCIFSASARKIKSIC